MKKVLNSKLKIFLFMITIIFVTIIITCVSGFVYMINYKNPADKKLVEAGIIEKTTQVGEINFNYAEGPDNGPVLVLLHAQLLDWYTYSETLPELSKSFHVFAIDYPGHGKTTCPENYSMNANQIGIDLAHFIETVIQKPVYMTGNSSGGLLTIWLAANNPDLVKAIVLEDPPLFSSEYPEIKHTIAYRAFTTSHNAIKDGYTGNFLSYWIDNSTQFFKTYTGPFSQQLINFAVKNYKKANPDEPVEIAFLPISVKEMIRGLNYYDPHFGTAFYEGTWNTNFDHRKALQKIQCPALLLHANFSIKGDRTLDGAMSQEQADLAISLIHNGKYMKVNSAHVINLEHPDKFIKIITSFFLTQ